MAIFMKISVRCRKVVTVLGEGYRVRGRTISTKVRATVAWSSFQEFPLPREPQQYFHDTREKELYCSIVLSTVKCFIRRKGFCVGLSFLMKQESPGLKQAYEVSMKA